MKGIPLHARKSRSLKTIRSTSYKEWSAVTAACMAIKRRVFLESGGLDIGYKNGCEDIDLCLRLKYSGYRHFVANNSIIYHYVSQSPGRNKYNVSNLVRFSNKWSEYSKELGKREWPKEYILRYARHWWKINPYYFFKALLMLIF